LPLIVWLSESEAKTIADLLEDKVVVHANAQKILTELKNLSKLIATSLCDEVVKVNSDALKGVAAEIWFFGFLFLFFFLSSS
jgi:hypothetical protein